MSLESIIAGMEIRAKENFQNDTKNLKYQLKAEQKNGTILKTASKNEHMFIIIEKDGVNKIVAGFIKKDENCYFQTYCFGGFETEFGKFEDLLIYKRHNSIYARNNIDGKEVFVKFFEDSDSDLKYKYNGIKSSGLGIL